MNKQISFIGVNTQSTFAPFPTSGATYAIYSPINENQNHEIKKHKERRVHTLGYSMGVSALVLGLGALFLAKGMPKNFYKKFEELFKNIEQKRKSLVGNNERLTKLQELYYHFLGGAKVVTGRAKALFNLGPLKDTWLKYQAKKYPLTNRCFNWITSQFEKVARSTSNRKYAKTDKKFKEMISVFNNSHSSIPKEKLQEVIEINGEKKTVAQWINELQTTHLNVTKAYGEGFDATIRAERIEKLNDTLERVAKQIYDMTWGRCKGLNLKALLHEPLIREKFLSEELGNPERAKYVKEVAGLKDPITSTLKDKVLPLYEKLLPPDEYGKVKEAADATLKSFDKSFKVETEKLFDKLRDLKIGCAPLDTLGLLTALGIISVKLAKADNNDERTSIGLLYGIPALGTIATISYCTAALISGGQAIIFGLLAGLAINKIGEFLDKKRKEFNENQAKQTQPLVEMSGGK